jgi:DNA invertase Pin-like site-specific DNA recombinase
MSKKTAIYARYSSHAQDGGTSIEVQVEACGRELRPGQRREYVDRARTGRSMAGRESLLRLLDDAEAGQIDRVLVYKYDRLGRNLAETSAVIAQLEDCGVEVVSLTEGKDALARGMHLVISEHYSRVLAERTRDGLIKRFEQKAWTGGPPPYGYRIVEDDGLKRLQIDETEAEVIRSIFADYLAGRGLKEIARRLHERDVPTRRGGPWTFSSVRSIIRNEVYAGRVSFNRRQFRLNRKTGRRVPQWRDADEVLSWQDESLRIIPADDYAKVEAKLARRARPSARPRSSLTVRPFTGLLYCENGHRCYSRCSKNGKGEYRYYSCSLRQRTSKDACDVTAAVREDKLIDQVTGILGDVFADAEGVIEEATALAERELDSSKAEANRIKSQLGELDSEIASLTRLLTDPQMEAGARKAVIRQIGGLESRRERLHDASAAVLDGAGKTIGRVKQAVKQAFAEAKESLATLATPLELHEFIEEFVGPLTLRRDGTVVPSCESRPRY